MKLFINSGVCDGRKWRGDAVKIEAYTNELVILNYLERKNKEEEIEFVFNNFEK